MMLVLASPVLACLGLLLKWESPGPVLYTQTRLGRGGKQFRIYKLRTMTHRCEAATGPVWSLDGDPRITRVGKWLRDTHLDEVPQLWNVVRGEMSLIGPRPERPEIAAAIERAMPEFCERLAVRPGMTGLAQVCLAADADLNTVKRKLSHDLAYAEGMGPVLDARIAIATGLHLVGRAASALGRRLVRGHAPARMTEPVRVEVGVRDGVVAVVSGRAVPELSKAA
jgi:lipopolysaccharide/colanic/teichoic acid biosynthesis glycosyltransferase